ncbi:early nodulin-like protein 1 [Andrographis paniculata]|uniref:early nodulin-like protein 1 n=1 Tax=Andrographis paniculata TaxID=175694 RepID=UPI0021E81781|nr:early nodulin-like protein 1 [Andrographis paniculata]
MAALARIEAAAIPIIVLLTLLSSSEGRDHLVGGKSDAWNIPAASSNPDALNRWASRSRFLIGDSLVWKYDGSKDSVLQVSKRDYVTCNTSSPIEKHVDGDTKVTLPRSGPYYFISGAEGHCRKGQKLIVVVLSERHSRRISVSPAPSPAEIEGPATAPAPASGAGALRVGAVVAAMVVGGILAVV